MTKISQFQQKIILFHDKNEVKIASALLYFNKTGFTELVMRNNHSNKKNETTYLAYFCWTEDMKYKKSMAVWKICQRSFKCDVAGNSSLICLEMAQEWMKTLPCSILQFNWIQKVLKRSSSLWRALTFKRFELQIWDWSRMKFEIWNLKIFKIT